MKRVLVLFIFLWSWHSMFSQSTVTLTVVDANCFSSTGTITINSVTNSATPNYTIMESATPIGTNVSLPFTFTNVSVGTHTYDIIGSNSFTVTFTVTIAPVTPPVMNVTSPVTLVCNPNTLTLSATTTATGIITYTWTGPSIVSGANTSTPVVDQPGTYNLMWMQGTCSGTNSVSVSVNTIVPTVSATSGGTVTCNNTIVVLTGTSNVSNATYSWSPQNITTSNANATAGGNYTLTVTDPANNCKNSTVLLVAQNTNTPALSVIANGSITCTQTMVVLTGSSSVSGVTYTWAPSGSNNSSISVTNVGFYTLTITDPANGCNSVKSTTVYQIPAFSASMSVLGHVKCNGASTGSAQIDVTGGSGVFSATVQNTNTFAGTFTAFPASITNLGAGTNTVFILDTLSGCTQLVNAVITEPPALVLNLMLTSSPEICYGDFVKISSSLSGGVFPYQYTWTPNGGNGPDLDVSSITNSYTLLATDANSCLVTAVKTLTVHPRPSSTLLNSPAVLCGSICVNFTLAAAQNTNYIYSWYISEKNNNVTPIQLNQYSPTVCLTTPGMYNVDISIISLQGCSTQSIFTEFVKLYPLVKAAYAFDQPDGPYIFNDVKFYNQSTGATYYSWYDENILFSDKQQPTYNFYEPGNYLVSLIAANDACSDTLSRKILVGENTFMHFPNSFTPNKDGLNDVWRPVFYGDFQGGTYDLAIFDRWGKKVFWTIIIDQGWDGTFKDKICEDGLYNWELKISSNGINERKLKGIITLMK